MNKDIAPEHPPRCPACGSICERETKVLKSTGITAQVWVCPEKKKPGCLD